LAMPPKRMRLSRDCCRLLLACDGSPDDEAIHAVAADRLEEEGQPAWGLYVRTLPRKRFLYDQWDLAGVKDWEPEQYEVFDSILWRFADTWRSRYREVPLLGNVTH